MMISNMRLRTVRAVLACAVALAGGFVAVPAAQAQTFEVLHTFHGPNGSGPIGGLVRDAAGNIYGTTVAGGDTNCNPPHGCGTAFMLNKAGNQVGLHSFSGANGENPYAGLLRDAAGNWFGTTLTGGDTNCYPPTNGCGTVFELNKAGKETVLYKFTGIPDGFFPEALLVEDTAGNLYGTTPEGGASGSGTVFKIDTTGRATGKETVLYSFTGGSDGCWSYPGVILDPAGNLYGVTAAGGSGFCNSGYGVVFKVDASGNEMVLHTFTEGDGANPSSVLLFDAEGNLYGTTQNGGRGGGVVFELSPQSGGGWVETVLYSFCALANCADGERPLTGPLVRDASGNLYGTTIFGGTSNQCNGTCGVVFKLDTTGKETVLHSFTGGTDGALPWAGLTMDDSGNLYGTATVGGDEPVTCNPPWGCGVVFKITP